MAFPARRHLCTEPFTHLDHLGPACCQGSENTQVLSRQLPPDFRPEQHEPRDELRIYQVGLCLRAPVKGNLCQRQLHSIHPGRAKRGSEQPFLTGGCLKSDPRWLGQILELLKMLRMACCGVGLAGPLPARRSKAVAPIARNINANHGCCWYHVALSSLYFAVP